MIREAGGDRSAVTGGTCVLSDRIVIEITQNPGEPSRPDFLARRERIASEEHQDIALNILLASLRLVLFIAVVTLRRSQSTRALPSRCRC